ncbi:hypothetical protein BDK51DRAFT_36919, partial [Blyttiomyces helicus]
MMGRDSASYLTDANSAFVDEDYDRALELYSQAVLADSSNAESYVKRSATYHKLGLHQQAFDDAQ